MTKLMSMKPGLSGKVYISCFIFTGKVYVSCFILCRDEKPTEYHIGNFLPGSITKVPTNKQRNHPQKKPHQKQKKHRLPPQNNNQNQQQCQ